MNGFLVVSRYDHDDLPMALFATLEEARDFLADEPEPNEFIVEAFSACLDNFWHNYRIIQFNGGEPVAEYATGLAEA